MLKKKDPSSRPAERVYRTGHRESIQRYFHNNDFFYSSGDSIIANKVVYRFSAVTVKCEARLRVTIFPSHPLMPPPPPLRIDLFFPPFGPFTRPILFFPLTNDLTVPPFLCSLFCCCFHSRRTKEGNGASPHMFLRGLVFFLRF